MKRPLFAIIAISLISVFGLPSGALAAATPSILVLPFAPAGNAGAYDWVGKGIQQSLQADLSGLQGLQVTFSTVQAGQPAPTGQEPADSLAVANRAGANLLVVGTYQINDNQLRITGEIYDVNAARNIGGIKATGAIADLFKLEDSLNDQLLHVLPGNHNLVNVPAQQPQQQMQQVAQAPVTADDGASSLPTAAATNVYVYSNGSSSYYPASYYPASYYAAPIYTYSSFCPFVPFCGPRFFCPAPRVFFRGGFGGGFHTVGFVGGGFRGGFGGGFHGGGGRR
jgi:TolB-like protein